MPYFCIEHIYLVFYIDDNACANFLPELQRKVVELFNETCSIVTQVVGRNDNVYFMSFPCHMSHNAAFCKQLHGLDVEEGGG